MDGKDDELADHFDRQLAAALFAAAKFSSPRSAATFAARSLVRHVGLAQLPEFEKRVEDAVAMLRAGGN